MPTSTRRQAHAHAHSRNDDTSEVAVQITSDDATHPAEAVDVEPEQNMEDDGLDGEEDDEEAAGNGLYGSATMRSSVLKNVQTRKTTQATLFRHRD